jgi:uncharacterized protein YdiU (UPF0061 family)
MVLLNEALCRDINLNFENHEELVLVLSGNTSPENSIPFAQAYAGHQFGHFTMLGDGRAILPGEILTRDAGRLDIQLKGCGQTPYSRKGDGRATLKAMLREYLVSEAMHYLNIPTSRSLAVVKTGEPVYREAVNDGAVLTRVMKSHIRIGTFEYARYFGNGDDLNTLVRYTINRIFPELEKDKNPALSFLDNVMRKQIGLVTHWMRVGFIHGVMNTDNTSVSGESFDYGPCAFMNAYHPDTVFSSIDKYGRYAFGKQPAIIKWNITRLAEALLPVIHNHPETAVKLAQQTLGEFDELWTKNYYETMLNKLGVESKKKEYFPLVYELLGIMKEHQLDYTNTFLALSDEIEIPDNPLHHPALKSWTEKWRYITAYNESGMKKHNQLLNMHNPVFIPRNHLVEEALNRFTAGNSNLFYTLLKVLRSPYTYNSDYKQFMMPSGTEFDRDYKTFCGT